MIKRLFPYNLLLFYILFYSGQAVYGGYISLYLDSVGFSKTQIGMFTSVATIAVLLTQFFWGYATDRSKKMNTILSLLLILSSGSILGFYLGTGMAFVMIVMSLFCVFYNPIPALMDSLTLETLDERKSKLNFGHIRLGGTLGYAMGVFFAGQLMNNEYRKMFYMISILFFLAFLTLMFISPTEVMRKISKEYSFKALIQNKRIFCFLFLQLIFALGMTIFYNYYPLYFTSIGGTSSLLGTMLFATAISEIPFWFISGRLIGRFGYERMMAISVCVVGLRWLVLFLTKNLYIAILVNMTHGFSFVTLNYSLVTYIDSNVPKELRATGQTMIAMLSTIFSRVIGGLFIGFFSDIFGIDRILLFAFVLSYVSVAVFFLLVKMLKPTRPA